MAGPIDRLKGWVKWFDSRRGFGFITPEGGGADLFVHQSSITSVGSRWLSAGERVEFVLSVNDDGRLTAVNVTGFGCNNVGHMAMDCDYAIPCYGFLDSNPPNSLWSLFKLQPLPPFPAVSETPVGQISEEQNVVIIEDSDEPKSDAEWRNWADLPGDILSIIFKKIAAVEILLSAQSVCKPWRELSLQPSIWRCIELRLDKRLDNNGMVSMAMMAVERSEGCVEDLYMDAFPTDGFMLYIADRATRLRGLHLMEGFINEEAFLEALRKFPLLEELEMFHCYCFSYKAVERIGKICPQLKTFRINCQEMAVA